MRRCDRVPAETLEFSPFGANYPGGFFRGAIDEPAFQLRLYCGDDYRHSGIRRGRSFARGQESDA
jgi:hypothetical protein